MKKITFLITIIILVFSTNRLFCQVIAPQKVKLSEVEFKSIFGELKSNKNIVFCLLGNGFFLAERSENTDSLISNWFDQHPNANVISLTSMNLQPENINSFLIYCLVIDGKDTLNNYIIKNGCYQSTTMYRPVSWDEMSDRSKELYEDSKPIVTTYINEKQYEDYLAQIIANESYAKANKLGVWSKLSGQKNEKE